MTFRKNFDRERTLLRHWMEGETVREAAEDSGIPEGTISHYYARFNRNKEKYQREYDGEYQEPPKTDPNDAAFAALFTINIQNTLTPLIQKGDYSKARDFLQMMLLYDEFLKKRLSIMRNVDHKEYQKAVDNMFLRSLEAFGHLQSVYGKQGKGFESDNLFTSKNKD